jgi:hypothetical protein
MTATPIPNYITSTDVSTRMTADAYTRWFSRTTQGTVDTAFVQLCIDDACSQWNVWMGDALAGDWTAAGGVVQNVVKRRLVDLTLYYAAEAQPRTSVNGQTSGNPWQTHYDAAAKFADQLRKGREARLLTEAVTTTAPTGGPVTVGDGGNTSDVGQSQFVRQANQSINTGF